MGQLEPVCLDQTLKSQETRSMASNPSPETKSCTISGAADVLSEPLRAEGTTNVPGNGRKVGNPSRRTPDARKSSHPAAVAGSPRHSHVQDQSVDCSARQLPRRRIVGQLEPIRHGQTLKSHETRSKTSNSRPASQPLLQPAIPAATTKPCTVSGVADFLSKPLRAADTRNVPGNDRKVGNQSPPHISRSQI